jgi:putative FmdB family regulatory protein
MPLFDFKCETCDYIEEVLLKTAGNSETRLTCPECEKETMIRQVGLSSFKLEGGGWYKDGYQKKSILKDQKEYFFNNQGGLDDVKHIGKKTYGDRGQKDLSVKGVKE